MATFSYDVNNGSLNTATLSQNFNRYRGYKQILDILIKLKKIHLSEYKVLEPACGGGDKLRLLTEYGVKPENCYGFDVSDAAIRRCRKLSPGMMNFQLADAFNTPYEDEFFDIIICSGLFGCYQNDEDSKKLAAELDRLLKYTGVLLICDLNENYEKVYGRNPVLKAKNLRGYDSKSGQLETLLSEHFQGVTISPLFSYDIYNLPDGSPLPVEQFSTLEAQLDNGSMESTYSLWSFIKK